MNQEPYQFKPKPKKGKNNKLKIVIIILVVLMLLLGMWLYFGGRELNAESEPIEILENIQESVLKEEEYTELDGYSLIELTEKKPYLYLSNLETNITYLKYKVLDEDGTQLYATDFIAPGETVNFNAYELLPEGQKVLTYSITIYDLYTKEVLRSGITINQEVNKIGA